MVKQFLLIALGSGLCGNPALRATEAQGNACIRPAPGSSVPEPQDLRSQNGVLKVDLTIHNSTEADGSTRYCYMDGNGNQAPNLRLKPGDLLILNLKNDLTAPEHPPGPPNKMRAHMHAGVAL
jgi:hypothetical protein